MRGVAMQPQFPLQILSKKLIKPAIPTPNSLRKFKISSIDQHRPPVYVQYIFFYPANVNDEGAKFAERSKQLQVSLSEVLTLFYPLAGRYIQENFVIDCNDDGTEYVEAKVARNLVPDFLNMNHDSKQLHHLIPHVHESPASPLVSVQYNVFECGGQAIGVCISHRIVDAFVLTKFIDGWATTCREGIIDKVHRLSFDLAVLLPPREIVPQIKPVVSPIIPNLKFASKAFVFSGLAISNLRKIAQGAGDKDSGKLVCQPSRVKLLTALIWKALMRMDQAKHGRLRPSVIVHRINMRGRTILPISDDCFGNFARIVMWGFTPDKRSNKVEFHELISLVSDKITSATTDCGKPQNGNELSMMVDEAWREAAQEFNGNNEVQYYMFTSTCRMPFYPDFGWRKPIRVTSLEGRSQVIIVLMDSRDGDGIEAWIHMDENDLSLFQQDPDIIAFTSQGEQNGGHSKYLPSRY